MIVKFKVNKKGYDKENKSFCMVDIYCNNSKVTYGYLIRNNISLLYNKYYIGKVIRYFVNKNGNTIPVIRPMDLFDNLKFSYSLKEGSFCIKNKNHALIHTFDTSYDTIKGNYCPNIVSFNFVNGIVFLNINSYSMSLVLKLDNKFSKEDTIKDDVLLRKIYYIDFHICNQVFPLKDDYKLEYKFYQEIRKSGDKK